MEWLSNFVDVLKIPLKILLLASCLFSGALTFLNKTILEKLGLFEWKTENRVIIGLIFVISTCLIIVYSVYYLKEKLSKLILKMTFKRKTMKKIF